MKEVNIRRIKTYDVSLRLESLLFKEEIEGIWEGPHDIKTKVVRLHYLLINTTEHFLPLILSFVNDE